MYWYDGEWQGKDAAGVVHQEVPLSGATSPQTNEVQVPADKEHVKVFAPEVDGYDVTTERGAASVDGEFTGNRVYNITIHTDTDNEAAFTGGTGSATFSVRPVESRVDHTESLAVIKKGDKVLIVTSEELDPHWKQKVLDGLVSSSSLDLDANDVKGATIVTAQNAPAGVHFTQSISEDNETRGATAEFKIDEGSEWDSSQVYLRGYSYFPYWRQVDFTYRPATEPEPELEPEPEPELDPQPEPTPQPAVDPDPDPDPDPEPADPRPEEPTIGAETPAKPAAAQPAAAQPATSVTSVTKTTVTTKAPAAKRQALPQTGDAAGIAGLLATGGAALAALGAASKRK